VVKTVILVRGHVVTCTSERSGFAHHAGLVLPFCFLLNAERAFWQPSGARLGGLDSTPQSRTSKRCSFATSCIRIHEELVGVEGLHIQYLLNTFVRSLRLLRARNYLHPYRS
jgi:hypothetical protein